LKDKKWLPWQRPLVAGYRRHPQLGTDWRYCFRFPDFPRITEWRGSKCRYRVRKSRESRVFRPSNLSGRKKN